MLVLVLLVHRQLSASRVNQICKDLAGHEKRAEEDLRCGASTRTTTFDDNGLASTVTLNASVETFGTTIGVICSCRLTATSDVCERLP